jgi:hypothetical protein
MTIPIELLAVLLTLVLTGVVGLLWFLLRKVFQLSESIAVIVKALDAHEKSNIDQFKHLEELINSIR